MDICAISDTHGKQGKMIPIKPVDVLLIAGDICPLDNHYPAYQANWLDREFRTFLEEVPAKLIVGVAGNHDFVFEGHPELVPSDLPWEYVQDQYVEFMGKKIYGSPWQPPFYDWAFNAPEEHLAFAWERIPTDTDILVTHSPARGLRDKTVGYQGNPPEHAGSHTLRYELDNRLNPDLHVFGHIHSGWGCAQQHHTLHANVSIVDEKYRPVHAPFYYEI